MTARPCLSFAILSYAARACASFVHMSVRRAISSSSPNVSLRLMASADISFMRLSRDDRSLPVSSISDFRMSISLLMLARDFSSSCHVLSAAFASETEAEAWLSSSWMIGTCARASSYWRRKSVSSPSRCRRPSADDISEPHVGHFAILPASTSLMRRSMLRTLLSVSVTLWRATAILCCASDITACLLSKSGISP